MFYDFRKTKQKEILPVLSTTQTDTLAITKRTLDFPELVLQILKNQKSKSEIEINTYNTNKEILLFCEKAKEYCEKITITTDCVKHNNFTEMKKLKDIGICVGAKFNHSKAVIIRNAENNILISSSFTFKKNLTTTQAIFISRDEKYFTDKNYFDIRNLQIQNLLKLATEQTREIVILSFALSNHAGYLSLIKKRLPNTEIKVIHDKYYCKHSIKTLYGLRKSGVKLYYDINHIKAVYLDNGDNGKVLFLTSANIGNNFRIEDITKIENQDDINSFMGAIWKTAKEY